MREYINIVEGIDKSEAERAVQALLDEFSKYKDPYSYYGTLSINPVEIDPPTQYSKGGCSAMVRHWGQWEVPAGEEDDGDYDWKQLTDESQQEAVAIVARVQARFPTIKLSYAQEEKEWISLIGEVTDPVPKRVRKKV